MVEDDEADSSSSSLAAKAIRASSAHRDSSLSSAYGLSPSSNTPPSSKVFSFVMLILVLSVPDTKWILFCRFLLNAFFLYIFMLTDFFLAGWPFWMPFMSTVYSCGSFIQFPFNLTSYSITDLLHFKIHCSSAQSRDSALCCNYIDSSNIIYFFGENFPSQSTRSNPWYVAYPTRGKIRSSLILVLLLSFHSSTSGFHFINVWFVLRVFHCSLLSQYFMLTLEFCLCIGSSVLPIEGHGT